MNQKELTKTSMMISNVTYKLKFYLNRPISKDCFVIHHALSYTNIE